MCGRYTLRTPLNKLIEQFGVELVAADFQPRYNIAPTQQVLGVRQSPAGNRELVSLRWGFELPAKGAAVGKPLIHARSETAASKPTFRAAFQSRRCLILADGFYEWQKVGRGKRPIFFHLRDDRPFALAGLWDHARPPSAASDVCTILTTGANDLLRPLHDRMPVILDPADHGPWLDPTNADVEGLQSLMRSYPSSEFAMYPVDPRVNSPGVDDPACIEPAADEPSSRERQRSLFP